MYTYSNGFVEARKWFVKVWHRGFEKKKKAKSSNLLLGKKWRIKTNLHRGSPNIFSESAMGDGGEGGGMKIAAKGHYKRGCEFVDNPLNINSDIRY